jgi:hypothetical protein
MSMHTGLRRAYFPLVLAILMGRPDFVGAQEGMHRISFKFDYDFGSSPACSKKVTTKCVQQFVLYDISAGIDKPTKLGTVPLPEHTKGLVKGITATTEPILFNPGRHMIAVVAKMADGSESDLRRCTTIVKIP